MASNESPAGVVTGRIDMMSTWCPPPLMKAPPARARVPGGPAVDWVLSATESVALVAVLKTMPGMAWAGVALPTAMATVTTANNEPAASRLLCLLISTTSAVGVTLHQGGIRPLHHQRTVRNATPAV